MSFLLRASGLIVFPFGGTLAVLMSPQLQSCSIAAVALAQLYLFPLQLLNRHTPPQRGCIPEQGTAKPRFITNLSRSLSVAQVRISLRPATMQPSFPISPMQRRTAPCPRLAFIAASPGPRELIMPFPTTGNSCLMLNSGGVHLLRPRRKENSSQAGSAHSFGVSCAATGQGRHTQPLF